MFEKLFVIKILVLLSLSLCAAEESGASPAVSNELLDKSTPAVQLSELVSQTPAQPSDSPSVTDRQLDSPAHDDGSDVEVILLPDKKSPFLQLKDHLAVVSKNLSDTKKFLDNKQINQKHITTRVALHQTIDAIYNCTQDSVLSVLTMSADFDNYFVCNQVLDLRSDNRLNATIRGTNEQNTPLTAYESSVQLVFFKGNQLYYSSARVDSGYCEGDRLTILNVGLARKGGCNSRSGVKQIVSEYALLTISGRCQSTCFGDVNVNLSPGVRN